MPATEALRILPRLVVLFGQDLLELILTAGDEKSVEVLLAQPEAAAAMLTKISENAIAAGDGLLVLRELMKHTECHQVQLANGTMKLGVFDHFDTHFAGRIMEIVHVAIAVAQASFSAPSPG